MSAVKIKLPPGGPSAKQVARTLGATAAEVRSVDRLLDELVAHSNLSKERNAIRKFKAASKMKMRRAARKRSR